jgi:hypothetical protein
MIRRWFVNFNIKVRENDQEKVDDDGRPFVAIDPFLKKDFIIFLFKTKKSIISAPVRLIDGLTPDLSLFVSNEFLF